MAFTLRAEGIEKVPPQQNWSFQRITGTFDRAALQRGFKVYREVCAACHGIKRVAIRHLRDLGFKEGQLKSIAKEMNITDGPNAEGKTYERPGVLSDHLVTMGQIQGLKQPDPEGPLKPDLSLITKARRHGADYVYAILTGYTTPPKEVILSEGQYYNEYFPGHLIAMTPPLTADGIVSYSDGTQPTIHQMAHDVTTFLAWASEPEMENRKQLGFKVLLYLLVMTVVLFLAKRRIWANIK